ncbi:AAA family ATPase [Roseibacillus persicicus]|uniref:AAA family ATPase n=1 Tax=Roseibacillus persicicus TaxID=454148 RepID=UPI0028108D5E|nr:AAA family ATPase [Roseibacillus persicicus]MDQ8192008.1 AAA family ATPase [Roseibacillus persicicus]
MRTLEKLTIKGFKSIRDQTLELDRLNVFIGGNGVGKSNLIGVFRLLHEVINQRLTEYVAKRGGADRILHFGRKKTPDLELEFVINDLFPEDKFRYETILKSTDEGQLFVHDEWITKETNGDELGAILPNSKIESRLKNETDELSKQLFKELDSYRVYHFHDTSETAAMKVACDLEDNRFLRPQAENLAAYLYYLQERQPDHFSLIEDTIRQVAPFFEGFRLSPSRLNKDKIRIEWREKGSDSYFNASAFSDGTLRFICLATLLLQPKESLPSVILLDEPELGLHPAAIALLADLLTSASEQTQILVATQSVTLVNHLLPDQVWTVNREGDQSVFQKLDQTDYSNWLEDYALGDLWEKNLINARP